jgi:hypothetical protein
MADKSWYENDPAVHTGSGRGSQGGASAAEMLKYKQDKAAQSDKVETSPDSSWKDSALTTLRGFGEGGTAGLIKYPQALLSSLTNGESYTKSLKDIRAENQRLSQDEPKAFLGGQVLGGLALGAATGGAALPTIGRAAAPSLARTIGVAGTTGAIQGATQNDYTTAHDMVGDIAAGGTAGAVGGAAAKGLGWLAGKPGEVLKKELIAGGFTKTEAQAAMSNPKVMEMLDTYGYQAFTTAKDILKGSMKPLVGGAITGGVAGAGHAALTGGDVLSETAKGAGLGATTTLAVTKAGVASTLGENTNALVSSLSGKALPAIPKAVQTLAPVVGVQAGSLGTGMNSADRQFEDSSWYTADPVFEDKRSPIKKEIDRWDSKPTPTTGVRG